MWCRCGVTFVSRGCHPHVMGVSRGFGCHWGVIDMSWECQGDQCHVIGVSRGCQGVYVCNVWFICNILYVYNVWHVCNVGYVCP